MRRRISKKRISNRGLILVAACAAVSLAAQPCQWRNVTPSEVSGHISEIHWEASVLEYLNFATAAPFSGGLENAIAHLERERRDPGYSAPVGALTAAHLTGIVEKLQRLEDTRDFNAMTLVALLLRYEDHPIAPPEVWDTIRALLLSFKYSWTDPTPPQPDPDDPLRDWDNSFYWTENHRIIYYTVEYLAGQRMKDACFWIFGFPRTSECTGPGEMTGQEHMDRARGLILTWLDERSRLGFAEFHSNVYYEKDVEPLLLLTEFAEDEEIRARAAMILDALLIDLALHTRASSFGVTHGRSEMKDKFRGPSDNTYSMAKLLFDQPGSLGYPSRNDRSAAFFSLTENYRLPEVIARAARDTRTFVDRSRHGINLDETAPVVPNPEIPSSTPAGIDFDVTPANLDFWWSFGTWTIWQVIPITITAGDERNLWNTDLFGPFKSLRDLLGDPPNLSVAQGLAQPLAAVLGFGFLKEANTYTYRTADSMLSTVQDYRKGMNGAEYHAWQATFDTEAIVFTTHPGKSRQPPVEWIGRTEGEPGYWTGSASMPRSAQHENVGIHIYSPARGQNGFLGFFSFPLMTHAYFPQDHFDEVVQVGSWTFGRKGDGYVALYSFRETEWETYTPEELAVLSAATIRPITQSFDLVARDHAENVWIVELGRAADWGSFEAFRDAVARADVEVTEVPGSIAAFHAYDVFYDSPSQGEMHFGWENPLLVDGVEIPLHDYPRMENPWVRSQWGDRVMILDEDGYGVVLDFDAGTRHVYGPLTTRP